MITRPMLAATTKAADLDSLTWPVMLSAKIDGIRCLVHPGRGPVTRSFKHVPNAHIYESLKKVAGNYCLDGELIAVDENGSALTFNETQSAVMSHSGRPQFRYMVFDSFYKPDDGFLERHIHAQTVVKSIHLPYIQVVLHQWVANVDEFLTIATRHIELGFEGTMIRSLDGPYKSGRSTLRQGWLLKYKQWADAEGTIVGFEELMRNENPDDRDEFDLAKRGHAKDGMVPAGTLGALILDTEWGELRVGTGFDTALRDKIWIRSTGTGTGTVSDLGRKVTFKYQPHGMQDLPRFPVFKGFREDE